MGKIDIAQRENERRLACALSEINTEKEAIAKGYCLNCGEVFKETNDTKRWCDIDCRNDWQKRRKQH